jgi:predicted ATPase
MIDSLGLKNFKAFSSLELSMAPLTLLAGINAVGKSTVLQALAVLRQSFNAGTLADEGLLLNGELVALGTGQDVLHEYYGAGGDGPEISIRLVEDNHEYKWSVGYGREDDLLRIDETPNHDLGGLSLFRPGFQYLRADRAVPAVSYPKSYEAAVRRAFLGATGEHAINYLRFHQDDRLPNTAILHPAAASSALLDQVTAWMQEFCPGVNLQIVDLEGTDSVRLNYGFFGTAGISSSNRYRPTNVGFGLTYVLPVVVAFLTAAAGTVVLLENPEAHLHPRGQTLMGRLACSAAAHGVQIVMESHSDHVLNGVRLAVKDGTIRAQDVALHYFQRNSAGDLSVAHPAVGPDGMLSEWPDGFFDEWDRTLDDLLS